MFISFLHASPRVNERSFTVHKQTVERNKIELFECRTGGSS